MKATWLGRGRGEHEGAMGDWEAGAPGEGSRGGIGAYRVLRDVAGEILATSDLEHLLERCGTLVQNLLRADACSIALLDERAGKLVPLLAMASGRSAAIAPLPLDLLDGRMLASINQGRSLVVAHGMIIDGDAPLTLSEAQSALTAMLIPLPLGQEMRGILWVGRVHGSPFGPEDQELAETIAALVALGVRGTGAFVRYQEIARRDDLPTLPDSLTSE